MLESVTTFKGSGILPSLVEVRRNVFIIGNESHQSYNWTFLSVCDILQTFACSRRERREERDNQLTERETFSPAELLLAPSSGRVAEESQEINSSSPAELQTS